MTIRQFFDFISDSWKATGNVKVNIQSFVLIVFPDSDNQINICLTTGAGKPGACYNVGMKIYSSELGLQSSVVFDGVFTSKELVEHKQEIHDELFSYYQTVMAVQNNMNARMAGLATTK